MIKILTIVVPVYNMERYLDRCLTSLIMEGEKMDSLEVLVINDGSKDRSSEIAHVYEDRYPRTFRVIDKENGNYGSCINVALPVASGKYVKVLDADDFFENRNLPGFLSFLERANADAVITHTKDVVDGNTTGELQFPDLPAEGVFDIEHLSACDINALYMHSITYKLDVLRHMGYVQLEGISYTDIQWITEPMIKVKTIQCWHNAIYNYVKGREGQTVDGTIHCKNMWMEIQCVSHCIDNFVSNKSTLLGGQISYQRKKLFFLASNIYRYYLIEYNGLLENENLINFDDYIKLTSLELYEELEENRVASRFFRFFYIKQWRKKRTRNSIPFILFDLFTYMKAKIKRM